MKRTGLPVLYDADKIIRILLHHDMFKGDWSIVTAPEFL